MASHAIDRWPSGERPLYHATPGAWEILQLLDRPGMRISAQLALLVPFSTRDLRGAYALTRDLEELRRREILVTGEDDGRALRISVRATLRRAFHQAQLVEESAQLELEAPAILDAIRAAPPVERDTYLRTVRQVLDMAAAAQPLPVRLRLLLAVRREDLAAGAARLHDLPPGRYIHGRWPSVHERQQLLRVLELTLALQQDLT